jgi:hypothetical protein
MVMQTELHSSCTAASLLLTDGDKPMNHSAARHLAFGSAGGVFTSAQWCCLLSAQWCCLLSTQLHSKNPCFPVLRANMRLGHPQGEGAEKL